TRRRGVGPGAHLVARRIESRKSTARSRADVMRDESTPRGGELEGSLEPRYHAASFVDVAPHVPEDWRGSRRRGRRAIHGSACHEADSRATLIHLALHPISDPIHLGNGAVKRVVLDDASSLPRDTMWVAFICDVTVVVVGKRCNRLSVQGAFRDNYPREAIGLVIFSLNVVVLLGVQGIQRHGRLFENEILVGIVRPSGGQFESVRVHYR